MTTQLLQNRFKIANGATDGSARMIELVSPVPTPLTSNQHHITDNLSQLLEVLPPAQRLQLERKESMQDLLEIVMDLGRIPEARYLNEVDEIGDQPVTAEDIDYVVQRIGTFGKDNRAGIERTLHRISAILNRQGRVVGLTCRVGRAVYGTIDIIQDVVESGKSILILGRPGRGKTTKLREVARILSEQLKKRVVIVDTSNEIAGDGDIPHPAIGRARRMQVATPDQQHNVMIEAVENHMPEVIVIDEIGTEQDAFAARTIAERGVQLVGTAHGNSLENLMMNPTLSDLVGGIHAVTLSDDEAKRRGTQKTVLERKAPPTFQVVIEIIEVDKLALHLDVEKTVDKMLRGASPHPEIRIRNSKGEIEVVQRSNEPGSIREVPDRESRAREVTHGARSRERVDSRREAQPSTFPRDEANEIIEDRGDADNQSKSGGKLVLRTPLSNGHSAVSAPVQKTKTSPATIRIFPYGVSRSRLDRAIMESEVPAYIARDVSDADVVVALKATYKREPGKMREAAQKRLPIYMVRSNTYAQIASCIRELFGITTAAISEEDSVESALMETQDAIEMVRQSNESVELAPANSYTRRLQHQLAERYQLTSESIGVEPTRRVRILPVTG